jgi:hypothetical protein
VSCFGLRRPIRLGIATPVAVPALTTGELVVHHHSRTGARVPEDNGGCYTSTTYRVSGTEGTLAVQAQSHPVLSTHVVGAIVVFNGGWQWPWINGTGYVAMLVKVNDSSSLTSPRTSGALVGRLRRQALQPGVHERGPSLRS